MFDSVVKQLDTIRCLLKNGYRWEAEYARDYQQWELDMMTTYTAHQDVVVLDVDGTRFSTSKKTINRIPNQFWTSLLRYSTTNNDPYPVLYHDQKSINFRYILNYMSESPRFWKIGLSGGLEVHQGKQ
jgi:hypothetical protein